MLYKKTTAPNGLRIITVPKKESTAVTILAIFKVGSRHESADLNGISHFVEHMMFKGTARRPTTLDISKALDEYGAEYNAFTSKDHTGYYIKISKNKVNLALDILSDMVLRSKFDQQELEREKSVIVEEINMYEDNPLMYVEELLEQLAFGQNNYLGRLIAGSRKTVRSLTRDNLIKYFSRHYSANKGVVVAAGAIDSKITGRIEKLFSGLNSGRKPENYKQRKISQNKPRIEYNYKKTEQIQLCLGFPAVSYSDQRRPALAILRVILGGNMSSRLFISVRERRGLAYYIKADVNLYEDTGLFYIQAGLDKRRLTFAVQAILSELNRVKKQGVTADELRKAKEFLRGKMLLDLEDSSSLASWFGRQEVLENRTETPEETFKKLEKVKRSDVQKMAKYIFRRSRANLAMIGSVKNPKEIRDMLNKNW